MSENPVYIYALIDPRTHEMRYVGKTVDAKRRLHDHVYYRTKSSNPAKCAWINELVLLGLWPELAVLETVPESEWQASECRHIALARQAGHRLTNISPGGTGPGNEDTARGERIALAKLTDDKALAIRREYAQGETTYRLAKKYGVTIAAINMLVKGKTWKHVPMVDCAGRTSIWKAARGDKNASRLYPEKRPRGDGHWSRQKPASVARGAANGAHTHPERLRYGADNHATKLTETQKQTLVKRRLEGESCTTLASEYGVSCGRVSQITRSAVPPRRRISVQEVLAILEGRAGGETVSSLAARLEIPHQSVSKIATRRGRRDVDWDGPVFHGPKPRDSCKWGHSYTAENTRMDAKGSRVCRTCQQEALARSYERRRNRKLS